MADKLTKQAALDAGNIFDKAAEQVEKLASMGVLKGVIAQKFAYQCDLLSDHTAKAAGINIAKLAAARKVALTGDDVFDEGTLGEDPEQIGEEKSGPKEQEADESYMDGHFSQQENRELRETQEGGDLGPDKTKDERRTPKPGIQAALANGQKLAALYLDINKAATKCASSEHKAVKNLGAKLASAGIGVLNFQARMLEGSESDERLATMTRAAAHVMPHLAGDVPPAAAAKLARMVDIFAGTTQAI
jgi:hypothetical protein